MAFSSHLIIAIRNSSFFKETIQHFLFYFSSNVLGRALTLGMLVGLTHFLTPEEYGKYQIFLAMLQIGLNAFSLNTHASISRYYYDQHSDFKEFVGSTIIIVLITFGITSGIFLLGRGHFSYLQTLPVHSLMFLPILALFWTLNSAFEQIFLPIRRSSLIATAYSLRAILIVVTTLTLVAVFHCSSHLAPIIAECSVYALFMVFYFYLIRNYCRFSFRWSHVQFIAHYSVPLVPYLFGCALLVQLDRILIGHLKDSASVGIYAFACNFGMAFTMISALALQAWEPSYYEKANNNRIEALNREGDLIFRMATSGAVLILLFGKDIGTHISGHSFKEAFDLLPLILGSFLLSVIGKIYFYPMFWRKRTGILSAIVTLGVAISVPLNYQLIPRFGYFGAAITGTITYAFIAIITLLFVRKALRIFDQFPLANFVPPTAIFVVVALISIRLQVWINPILIWPVRAALAAASIAGLLWPILRPGLESAAIRPVQ